MSDTREADLGLLGRAARIGTVLTSYGLGERGAADVPLEERAKSLRAALEELGPTFAKLGQILSTRPDLLPPEFIAELSTLQDQVPPMTEAEVVEVMEERAPRPVGGRLRSHRPGAARRRHDRPGPRGDARERRPRRRQGAAARRGGGDHARPRPPRAVRGEGGEPRRPAAARRLPSVIRHLSESLKRELDFRMEAANVDRLGEVLERYSRLAVPSVYHELSSKRLLVLELRRRRPHPRHAGRARALRGCAPADRVVLPAGARRRVLPRRPAPRQPALVGRLCLLPRLRHGRRGRTRRSASSCCCS